MLMSEVASKQDVPNSVYYSIVGLVDWIYPCKCVNCGAGRSYVCQRCRRLIGRKGASLRYTGVVRKIMKAIKYRGTYDMVKELVEIWDPPAPDQVTETIVTWVPMWEPKRKLRGFDQAELIAREVGRRWGVEPRALLMRARETKPMYGLNKSERAENVRGAFRLNPKFKITNYKQVVLVDDVWTTGATMRECVRVLGKAGVKRVWCLTVAA